MDAASSGESRAPKRPRANASAQSSVWHTPAALKRRRSIASLLGRAYVATDSLYAVIVSLLAPLVQEWDFTVKLQTDAGYNKGTVWAEMMGRIRKCCPFEVRDFKGHALQMCNISCALPRVVLLLARSTDDQQCAALRHFQTCVQCGGSLTVMSTILRFLIQNYIQGFDFSGDGCLGRWCR